MPGLPERTPWIGRASELALARDQVVAACAGAGSTLLVSGEAGIGKSRLIQEIGRLAGPLGFRLITGACFENDRALPFAPLIDLVRGLIAGRSAVDVRHLLGPAVTDLVTLLPELATLQESASVSPTLGPEAEKRRLFQAFHDLIGRFAVGHPLLLVIEDLHWSDDTSLEYLLHLARRIPAQPIVLILSYRSDEIGETLAHTIADLERQRLAREIALTGFDQDETDQLIRSLIGERGVLTVDLRERVRELTAGNPFFVEEVTRLFLAAGGRWLDPGSAFPIPRTIQDTVGRRTGQIGDSARETLRVAAIIGQRAEFFLLAEVTGRTESQLIADLKDLLAANLLTEEAPDRFSFRHDLTRQAVISGLLARERRDLHRRVLAALRRTASGEESLTDLALHAYEGAEWPVALDYCRRAGEQAIALYAPRAAAFQFGRAIAAATALGLGPQPDLLRQRARAYETLGLFDHARADHEAALAEAQSAGDHQAEWQALLDLGALWASRDFAETGRYYTRALALARQEGDSRRIGQSLNRIGNWHTNDGDLDTAIAIHREALALFETLGDQRGIAESLDLLGVALALGGDTVEGAACIERAITLFEALDDRYGLVTNLTTLTWTETEPLRNSEVRGLRTQARPEAGERALAIARTIDWRGGESYALIVLNQWHRARGHYREALDWGGSAVAIAEEIGHNQWFIAALGALAEVYLDLFLFALARRTLDRVGDVQTQHRTIHFKQSLAARRALASIGLGDLAGAATDLRMMLGPDTPTQTAGQRYCWHVRAELALAEGDPQLALAIADQLIATAVNLTPDRPIAGLCLLRGQALAALGCTAEAEEALRSALAAARARDAAPIEWRALLSLGRLLEADGRSGQAELTRAYEIVDALAEQVPDDPLPEGISMREAYRQAAATLFPKSRPLTSLRSAKQASGGLTRREREVAALIAQGKSNREIARALVLSETTVESHVGRILTKLDFSSRAQVAVWAAVRGLAAE